MMKIKIVIPVVCILALAAAFIWFFLYERTVISSIIDEEAAWDLRDNSPQMKVIVTDNGLVARFTGEDDDTYIGDIQDTFTVDKNSASLEVWYACDGKGVVFLKDFGEKVVYAEPLADSEVIDTLVYEKGFVPDTYRCLGYRDGWFKIELDENRAGYVSEEFVIWDAIDSF